MQHKTLEELQRVAAVHPDRARPAMTRSERLERWAELLEREPERRLSTLPGTEFQRSDARDTMRSLRSPITVAFEDPVLRVKGLTNDSYGEAKRFFEVTDGQLHDIVCYCHYGTTVSAKTAAHGVRAAISQSGQPGVFARLWEAIVR